jgi:hypothetical protein
VNTFPSKLAIFFRLRYEIGRHGTVKPEISAFNDARCSRIQPTDPNDRTSRGNPAQFPSICEAQTIHFVFYNE